MVTFPPVGRAGNFMFECATSLAYSLKHSLDFTIPFSTTSDYWCPIYFQHLRNDNFNHNLEKIKIPENGHQYQSIPFDESWRDKNIIIEGYRQSAKYFDEFRHEILYLFGLRWELRLGWVAFHIRRGDYVQLPTRHPVVTHEFISKALQYFTERGYTKFAMFSDGLDWVKQNVNTSKYPDCEFEYNEKKENALDNMILGSNCEHQISSNGTYGWWMGWLNRNPNKIVVIPHKDNWFGTDNKYLSVDDIYPEDWVQIPYTPIYDLPNEQQLIYQ